MKIPLLFTALSSVMLLGVPLGAAPEEQAVASTIESVSVFPQGAEISRILKVELQEGENLLLVEHLPMDLRSDSLRAAQVGGVALRLDNQVFDVDDEQKESSREKELKDQIEAIDQQLADLVQQQRQLEQRQNFAVQAVQAYLRNFGNNETGGQNLEKATELLKFREETQEEAYEKTRALNLDMARLNDERRELDKELNKIGAEKARLGGRVHLRLFAAEAGDATLAISYMVNRANWYPAYNLRVNSETGKMVLEYAAKISQFSGEDWDGVELSLHTQRPQMGGDAPVLNPVYLSPGWNNRRSKVMAMSDAVMDEAVMYSEAPAPQLSEAGGYGDKAQFSQGFTSFSVTLPSKAVLNNEKQDKQFPILQEELETEFWSEVVAPVSTEAFLKGKTENSLELPLLPGRAQVFIDGNLNSRVQISQILPGEELELSLGRDPLIVVERKLAVRKTEYSGIIDKTTTLIREYETLVTNYHPRKHHLKVKDHFPISQNEKIIVKPKDPDDVEVDEKSGEFVWDFELKAKDEKKLKTAYEVVHPRDWNLEDSI